MITWPQFCRAQSSATAYRTALDLIRRYPTAEVQRRLEEKIQEKEATCLEWQQQQTAKRVGMDEAAYDAQKEIEE